MFSFETGGAMTPVGDPPNVIIASNPFVIKNASDIKHTRFIRSILISCQLFHISGYKFRNVHHAHVIGNNFGYDSDVFHITIYVP